MHCKICDKNFLNYYYRRHIKTVKHRKNLNLFKEKIDDENEYNKYLNEEYSNSKTKTKSNSIVNKCFIKIKYGNFIVKL